MCSTCNHNRYEMYEVTKNGKPVVFGGKPVVRLRNAHDELDIHCDLDGKNYKIGNFSIYVCPTCGQKLV